MPMKRSSSSFKSKSRPSASRSFSSAPKSKPSSGGSRSFSTTKIKSHGTRLSTPGSTSGMNTGGTWRRSWYRTGSGRPWIRLGGCLGFVIIVGIMVAIMLIARFF